MQHVYNQRVQFNLTQLIERVAAVSARASGLLVAGERISHLHRRLEGFIGTHGIAMLEALLRKSEQGDSKSIQALRNALSVNYTYFWRDPDHFQYLMEHLMTRLRVLSAAPAKQHLRLLSAGCASGEESWSMAMAAAEAVRLSKINATIDIVAVDIDTAAIEEAGRCVYNEEVVKQLPTHLRSRYLRPVMHRHTTHWQVADELRTMVRFHEVDLLAQYWPYCEVGERFDAIFCRNVIIYISDSARIHMFEKFSALLRSDGLMILSRVEGGINHAEPYFKPCGDSVYMLGAAARRTVN